MPDMNVITQSGTPSNSPETLQIGNARLTRDELTALLIQAGHPDPNVAMVWLMNGTTRQPIVRRTARDLENEMRAKEAEAKVELLTRVLRRKLSTLQVRALDACEEWMGSESLATRLGISQQHASNILAQLLDLGLVQRRIFAPDGRVRLYKSVLGAL